MRRSQSIMACFSVIFCSLAASFPAGAQPFPNRSIRVLNSSPVGGLGDVALRIIAEKASSSLGQPIVIETQSAATGQIATQTIVRADPNGYSLLWGNSNLVNTQVVKKELPYNVLQDLAPVSLTVTSPTLIAINADLPINSPAEFVKYLKTHDGQIAFGNPGFGSGLHLAAEMLAKEIGVKVLHVPYSGGTSGMNTDLMENRIQVLITSLPTIAPVLPTGRVRLIAVLARDRYAPLPDLPTIFEVLPNYKPVPVWFGMLAPKNTPDTIRNLVSKHLREAANDIEIKRKLEKLGLVVTAGTPAEMGEAMKRGIDDISALVKEIRLEVQ